MELGDIYKPFDLGHINTSNDFSSIFFIKTWVCSIKYVYLQLYNKF